MSTKTVTAKIPAHVLQEAASALFGENACAVSRSAIARIAFAYWKTGNLNFALTCAHPEQTLDNVRVLTAQIRCELTEGVSDKSRAMRAGLAKVTGMSRAEAERWALET